MMYQNGFLTSMIFRPALRGESKVLMKWLSVIFLLLAAAMTFEFFAPDVLAALALASAFAFLLQSRAVSYRHRAAALRGRDGFIKNLKRSERAGATRAALSTLRRAFDAGLRFSEHSIESLFNSIRISNLNLSARLLPAPTPPGACRRGSF